ncbi:unnamed protein product [Diamesa hyperborea]
MATFKNILKLLIVLQCTYVSWQLTDYEACQVKFNCTKLLTQNDCPVKQFLDPKMTNGCCHGCRGGKSKGESGCSPKKLCAPGLKCDDDFYCIFDRASCLHTVHFEDVVDWRPNCEKDGSYSAKQCRGDKITGRCFCYAETGAKIYGWDWWNESEKMTCACSRQRAKAESEGRLDVTLHCTSNGNYEQLQCDLGICWCAEETTGNIIRNSIAVPDSLWTYLPCYDSIIHGDQYLRRCESAAHAQRIIQKTLLNHGAINAVPNQIKCNYDGTYGELVIENPFAFCQMPDGTKLKYTAMSKLATEMNCNCARDELIFMKAGIYFNSRCKENGNYESIQDHNGKIFCVDRDGYAVTRLMDFQPGLDCDMFLYYAQEDEFIEEEIDDNFWGF